MTASARRRAASALLSVPRAPALNVSPDAATIDADCKRALAQTRARYDALDTLDQEEGARPDLYAALLDAQRSHTAANTVDAKLLAERLRTAEKRSGTRRRRPAKRTCG